MKSEVVKLEIVRRMGDNKGTTEMDRQYAIVQDLLKWFTFNDIFLNSIIVQAMRCQALPPTPNYITLTEFSWIICNICNSIAVVSSFTRTRYRTCIP